MLLSTLLSILAVFASASAYKVPTAPKSSAAAACTPGQTFNATLYTVKPDNPTWSGPNTTSPYYIRQDEQATNKRLQLLVFPDIPPGAKNCYIGWYQPLSGTDFGYFTTATLEIRALNLGGQPLTSIVDADAVSYASIEPLLGEETGQADFTYWPEATEALEHKVGAVKGGCQGEIALLPDFVDQVEEGSLVAEQSAGKGVGWYLEWEC